VILDVSHNLFFYLPEEIAKLTLLEELQCSHNPLKMIPSSLSFLKNLKKLFFSHNELSDIPSFIASLENLTHLDISHNALSFFPEDMHPNGRKILSHLIHLDLSHNELKIFPKFVFQYPNLSYLDLSNTSLPELLIDAYYLTPSSSLLSQADEINAENLLNSKVAFEGCFSSLNVLKISGNKLKALPIYMIFFQNLENLSVSQNQLRSMPSWIGFLQKLQFLDFSHNFLTSVPKSISQLNQLELLNLSHNEIDILPDAIGKIFTLKFLDVSHNQLSSLPVLFSQLINLIEANLSHNEICSFSPIEKWTSLQKLTLSHSQLKKIPKEVFALKNLQELDLSENKLTEIPLDLMELTDLRILNLSGNSLKKIPEEIFFHPNLETLILSENALTSVPFSSLSKEGANRNKNNVSKLSHLDLSHNRISFSFTGREKDIGSILSQSYPHLSSLNLSYNSLESAPLFLFFFPKLSHMDLSHNHLKNLPFSSEGKQNSLFYHDFSSKDLFSTNSLKRLYLRGNFLRHIPTELRLFRFLSHLDLSENPLEEIPDWTGSYFLFMEKLEISMESHSKRENHSLPRSLSNQDLQSLIAQRNQTLNSHGKESKSGSKTHEKKQLIKY
jgi:Leucine-rich repeat (LRR) protein